MAESFNDLWNIKMQLFHSSSHFMARRVVPWLQEMEIADKELLPPSLKTTNPGEVSSASSLPKRPLEDLPQENICPPARKASQSSTEITWHYGMSIQIYRPSAAAMVNVSPHPTIWIFRPFKASTTTGPFPLKDLSKPSCPNWLEPKV